MADRTTSLQTPREIDQTVVRFHFAWECSQRMDAVGHWHKRTGDEERRKRDASNQLSAPCLHPVTGMSTSTCLSKKSSWALTYRCCSACAESMGDSTTYSTNSDRHNSSFLVKACNALHVPPRRRRSWGSRISSNAAINSSGSRAKCPADCFKLTLEVSALPLGRTASGCRRTKVASSLSPSCCFLFLTGGCDESKAGLW